GEYINTTMTQSDINTTFATWQNLTLDFNAYADDIILSFQIANTSANVDNYIEIDYNYSFTTENSNIDVYAGDENEDGEWENNNYILTPKGNAAGATANYETFTLKFKVINKEVDVKKNTNVQIVISLKLIHPQEKEVEYYEDEDYYYDDNFHYWNLDQENNTVSAQIFSTQEQVVVPQIITYDGYNYVVNNLYWDEISGDGSCDNLQSIVTHNGITSIGAECNGEKEIDFKIPYSVIDLYFSWLGCDIVIPNSVKNITLYQCELITRVDLPIDVKGFNFENCSSLKYVTIPEGVEIIPAYAFSGCAIEEIILSESLTSIGYGAFYACNLNNIYIPKNVEHIEAEAFSNNLNLVSIVVDKQNQTYDSRENCNAIIETSTNALICACNNTLIPDSVIIIGEFAFSCVDASEITIPENIEMIYAYAFSWMNNLTTINFNAIDCEVINGEESVVFDSSGVEGGVILNIGNKVENIPSNIGFPTLKEINFGNNVKSVGENAINNGDYVTNLYIPKTLQSFANGIFANYVNLETIVVEEGNGVYESPNNCNALIEVATKTLIRGCNNTTSIPNDVKSIGEKAFYGCTGLNSITIPSNVTIIGDFAFSGCTSLNSITIPNQVTRLGRGVFWSCTSLNELIFEVTEGWQYSRSAEATSGTPLTISSTDYKKNADNLTGNTGNNSFLHIYVFRPVS
ncbi:MAG: leucine-rich repeat domain-containing protein, partial [Clostridia bacterium]|nr:leucine-rich repeat domain-containing protein [Clostridia bacterium]